MHPGCIDGDVALAPSETSFSGTPSSRATYAPSPPVSAAAAALEGGMTAQLPSRGPGSHPGCIDGGDALAPPETSFGGTSSSRATYAPLRSSADTEVGVALAPGRISRSKSAWGLGLHPRITGGTSASERKKGTRPRFRTSSTSATYATSRARAGPKAAALAGIQTASTEPPLGPGLHPGDIAPGWKLEWAVEPTVPFHQSVPVSLVAPGVPLLTSGGIPAYATTCPTTCPRPAELPCEPPAPQSHRPGGGQTWPTGAKPTPTATCAYQATLTHPCPRQVHPLLLSGVDCCAFSLSTLDVTLDLGDCCASSLSTLDVTLDLGDCRTPA